MTDSEPPVTKGYKELVTEAEANIESLTTDEALARLDDDDVVFVDVRTVQELKAEGKIPDAVLAPRGLLEFHIDPASPEYNEEFTGATEFLVYCKAGWRSPLAAQRLQEMGLDSVAHLEGGFKKWDEEDKPVEEPAR